MQIAKMLQSFCRDNGRAIITKEERERFTAADADIERVLEHYAKFGSRVARDRVKAVKCAYVQHPTEENRAALDKVQLDWRKEEDENGRQRRLINMALIDLATKASKDILGPILLRAANALAWIAVQTVHQDKARCSEFGVSYEDGPVTKALLSHIIQLRRAADRIEDWQFSWNGKLSNMAECQWVPVLMLVEGDIWTMETLDPRAKTLSDTWRDYGQIGNPLFSPLLCEFGKEHATHDVGKPKKNPHGPTLPDCRPVIRKKLQPAGPQMGFVSG